MAEKPIPVIVGVGDVVNRSRKIEDATEPLELMTRAINKAISDSCPSDPSKLRNAIDSLDVVRNWTWPYEDIAALISQALDVNPQHRHVSDHGGNQPARLLDEAARRISKGESKVAVLTGGEALASLSACAAAKQMPPPGWTKLGQSVQGVFSPTTRKLEQNLGAKHNIGAPIHVYPLYENAFRAKRGQSISENNDESASMYAEFARIAMKNEYSWSLATEAKSKDQIGRVSKENRMICFPYPLLMNAFNNVNLSAAVILTSAGFAQELGIPQDKWIYTLGGAGCSEHQDFWQRPNFHSSAAMSRSLDTSLSVSGLSKDDIDLFDLYSCFPIVPKLACSHLGLATTGSRKALSLLGGLTSFGGAGNNYSMHAVTEMTRQLRKGNGQHGLVLANGGVLSYQHVVCLSSRPREDGMDYPAQPPLQDRCDDEDSPVVIEVAEGEAVVETYTVEFGKDGKPLRGHVVGRLLSDGSRFLANHADQSTLNALSSWTTEPIGRLGVVRPGKGDGNLFCFTGTQKI